jgi:hypothetical protein
MTAAALAKLADQAKCKVSSGSPSAFGNKVLSTISNASAARRSKCNRRARASCRPRSAARDATCGCAGLQRIRIR